MSDSPYSSIQIPDNVEVDHDAYAITITEPALLDEPYRTWVLKSGKKWLWTSKKYPSKLKLLWHKIRYWRYKDCVYVQESTVSDYYEMMKSLTRRGTA